ncbi:hypothetical protein [Streptomyces sp. NPDC046712]|uniref:hypothetical protein n=1 Tax=Streptomyces sp. NPDC046712 TaxID=3154802 RepID=UPI0033E2FABD
MIVRCGNRTYFAPAGASTSPVRVGRGALASALDGQVAGVAAVDISPSRPPDDPDTVHRLSETGGIRGQVTVVR